MAFQELNGKRVLITGASTGIGAAVARALGGHGARVGVHYNASAEAAEQVAEDVEAAGGSAQLLAADVRDSRAVAGVVDAFADKHGGIDVLINNAGGTHGRTPIEEIDDAHYDSLLDLNARSAFAAARAAMPRFKDQGHGNVISTSSIAARSGGSGGLTAYAGSKGFVSSFTRSLAKEGAKHGIRANAVSPGTIDTRFHQVASTPEQLDSAKGKTPLGRLGTPEDCVGTYLFLATDALSGFVTGQVIEVNGGQLVG